MKIKLFNKQEKWKYSSFSKNSESIFKDEGHGLKFAFEIYKTKIQNYFEYKLNKFFSSDDDDLKLSFFDKRKRYITLKRLENEVSQDYFKQIIFIYEQYDKKSTFDVFLKNYYEHSPGLNSITEISQKNKSGFFFNILSMFFFNSEKKVIETNKQYEKLYKEPNFPHYLSFDMQIFNDSLDFEYKQEYNNTSQKDFLIKKIINSKKQNTNSLNSIFFIIGETGSGKTATQLFLAYNCLSLKSELFESDYLPCYLDTNYINESNESNINILNIISNSTGFKGNIYNDKFLRNSPPILFLLDLNAISSSKSIKEPVSEKILIILIKEFNRLFNRNENRHRLVISFRGNHELLKFQRNRIYELMENIGIIWQIEPLNQKIIKKYIYEISGEKGIKILKSFLDKSIYITRIPIVLDFINWIALKDSEIGIIKSKAHLYLIMTRELLRLQYKQWEKDNLFNINNFTEKSINDKIFSLDEDTFSKICNLPKYSLEEKIHPVENLLHIIANELGNCFSFYDLEKKIDEISLENENINQLKSKNSNISDSLVSYSLLKNGNGKIQKIEFFHSSISDFFKAKSYFYDMKNLKFKTKEIITEFGDDLFTLELFELESKIISEEIKFTKFTNPKIKKKNLEAKIFLGAIANLQIENLIISYSNKSKLELFKLKSKIISEEIEIKTIDVENLIRKLKEILKKIKNTKYSELKKSYLKMEQKINTLKKIDDYLEVNKIIDDCEILVKQNINIIAKSEGYCKNYILRGMERYHLKEYEGALWDLNEAVKILFIKLLHEIVISHKKN